MRSVIILHDNRSLTRKEGEKPIREDYTLHFYPFERLIIKCHIHPKYAIYKSGEQLNQLSFGDSMALYFKHSELEKVASLNAAWSNALPGEAMIDTSYGT